VAVIGVGLLALVAATVIAGVDSVLALGLVVWAATFACLVAPATRRTVSGG
jgi:hypothetical protein